MQNCYSKSNKIPRDLQVGQDDRLSNKHIQTLKFLQEIVEENKQLKNKMSEYEVKFSQCAEVHVFADNAKVKIAQIQEQYLGRADEINAILLEKHKIEIMQRVEENVNAEKQWLEEKQKLVAEIERLKKENSTKKHDLEECKEHDHRIRMLDLKVAAQVQELQRLLECIKSMRVTEENQTAEIHRLKNVESKNKSIKDEIAALIQTNKEQKFKISRLEKDLANNENKDGSSEQEEIINTLKSKLAKLYKENTALESKQKEYIHTIDSLKSEIALLRKSLSDSETMRKEMQDQLNELITEIDLLKKMFASKDREKDRDRENFKEFVQLKREVQHLREENEFYRNRQPSGKSSGHLPMLRSSGGGSGKGTTVKRIPSEKAKPPPTYALYKT